MTWWVVAVATAVVEVVVEAALPGVQAAAAAVTQEQPAMVCRKCLSRALRQEVTTSVAQGGVVVLASVVVDVGLEAHLNHR